MCGVGFYNLNIGGYDTRFKIGGSQAEAMRIDSSGNVGIGVSSPQTNLHVSSTGDTAVQITKQGSVAARVKTVAGALTFGVDGANGDTERMRIDSSGNLLVGDASATFNDTAKTVIRPSSDDWSIKSAVVHSFNRTGSDGDILEFYRTSSAKVGSIGVEGGNNLYIGSSQTNHSGLNFTFNAISPMLEGSLTDATVALGTSSRRFTDLYLSGGVYLGGTGSANKLSSYETGTWTPALLGYSGVSYSSQNGYYTKVGRLVVAHFRIGISSTGTYTGNSRLGGLPFNAGTNNTSIVGNAPNILTALNQTRDHQYFAVYNGGYDMFCYTKTGGALNYNIWQAGEISGVITYFTT